MIHTHEDLVEYLQADSSVQPPSKSWLKRRVDRVFKMKVLLRKSEYHYNNRNKFFHKICWMIQWYRCKRLQNSFCSEINMNVFGKGLLIWHPQRIIVNPSARVGEYCSISSGVVIAHAHQKNPTIGNYVELMIDSKVLGDVHVPDHVRIGANTCVLKDISEPNTTWAGYPAKKINDKGTIEEPVPIPDR